MWLRHWSFWKRTGNERPKRGVMECVFRLPRYQHVFGKIIASIHFTSLVRRVSSDLLPRQQRCAVQQCDQTGSNFVTCQPHPTIVMRWCNNGTSCDSCCALDSSVGHLQSHTASRRIQFKPHITSPSRRPLNREVHARHRGKSAVSRA